MIYDLHLNRRMRTAAHQPRAAQFRRAALHTFYKKCARGECAAVSRAYVSKVLRGEEVNISFATPLPGHRLWRLAQGLEAGFAALRASLRASLFGASRSGDIPSVSRTLSAWTSLRNSPSNPTTILKSLNPPPFFILHSSFFILHPSLFILPPPTFQLPTSPWHE